LKTQKQFSLIAQNFSITNEEIKKNSKNDQNNNNRDRLNNSDFINNHNVEDTNKSYENINTKESFFTKNSQDIVEKDSSLFSNISKGIMNLFSSNYLCSNSDNKNDNIDEYILTNKSNQNNYNDTSILLSEPKIENLDIPKIFINYPNILSRFHDLDIKKKNLFEKAILREIFIIIKEFIPHFANFKYEISEAIDLLVDLSTKFKLEKEKLNYFITYLNSNFYTIKNKIARLNHLGRYISERNSLKKKNIKEIKIDSIILSINYLDNKSKLRLLEINKNFRIKNHKKIYFKIMKDLEISKKLTNEIRLNIWKKILRVVNFNIIILFKMYEFKIF